MSNVKIKIQNIDYTRFPYWVYVKQRQECYFVEYDKWVLAEKFKDLEDAEKFASKLKDRKFPIYS